MALRFQNHPIKLYSQGWLADYFTEPVVVSGKSKKWAGKGRGTGTLRQTRAEAIKELPSATASALCASQTLSSHCPHRSVTAVVH